MMPVMSLYTPKGSIVYYTGENGYDCEREYLESLGITRETVLTVESIEVGRSSSKVIFEEYPNQRFNTVLFDNVIMITDSNKSDVWMDDFESRYY